MVRNSTLRSDAGGMVEGSGDPGDTQCGCTWNGYTLCDRLQVLAKPQFFLVVLILQGIVQGVSETFFIKTISSTTFGVPYTTTRWLILSGEVALVILAIPVIYWGSEKRRPAWLAGSTVFLSVSSIVLASQLLLEHFKNTPENYNFSRDSVLCQPWYQAFWIEKWRWNWITIITIPLLHFGIGLSIIFYWAFGISYIDDNATNRMSPLFIGVALAFKQFGPFIGLFLSSKSVTITLLGIFWLITGCAVLLVAILTGMFPKRLSGFSQQRSGDSGLIPAVKRVTTNKIIIFSGLAVANLLTFVTNESSIEEKYIESTFYIAGNSLFGTIFSFQYLFGILKPTVAAASLLISGIVIHKIKPRALLLCIWSIISICVAAGAIFAIIFLKCSATPIHREDSRGNLDEYCNINCGCSEDIPFMPTCTPFSSFVYYSPCHAGCTTSYISGNTKVYSNCSCVPTGTVEVGHCSGGKCRIYWWIFEVLVLIATAFLASGFIGNLLICFRSILQCDKTVMVGLVFTISSFIAKFPLKIVYDFIANWSCLYFVDSQCKIYNSDKLATYINLFHISLLLSAAGMLTITCFLVQDLALFDNQSVVKNITQPMTEMTDFRSQLNQALKARRESAAEEQKLLSEPVTQAPHGYENGTTRSTFIEEDTQRNSSENGQKKSTLQKPLIPVNSHLPKDNTINQTANHSEAPSSQNHPVSSSAFQKPLVPVKSAALINEIKASLSSSTVNSSPPASPTNSDGITVRNQGFLTTLL